MSKTRFISVENLEKTATQKLLAYSTTQHLPLKSISNPSMPAPRGLGLI
ncbi:hypothetical protein [Desulfurococcus amylolyticus]|nr:hypothetical protein [Desulfurococcus amylolyticus]